MFVCAEAGVGLGGGVAGAGGLSYIYGIPTLRPILCILYILLHTHKSVFNSSVKKYFSDTGTGRLNQILFILHSCLHVYLFDPSILQQFVRIF